MNSSLISVKLEPELKRQVQEIAAELGVNITTVVKAKLKEFVRTKSLYISLTEEPSPELVKILRNADTEPTSPAFTNYEEAIKWLKTADDNQIHQDVSKTIPESTSQN